MSAGVVVAVVVGFIAGHPIWFRLRSGRARALVAAGAALIDVRTPREFEAGHLPNARNLPLDRLVARPQAVGSKERPVVVYRRSGSRSGMAARVLRRAGYGTIVNLGPMIAWGAQT